jgi:hypothetical protein
VYYWISACSVKAIGLNAKNGGGFHRRFLGLMMAANNIFYISTLDQNYEQ